MSLTNVEIVSRAMAAYWSEPPDLETLRELVDPDLVTTSSWGVDAMEYHGAQGALTSRAEMSVAWDSWEQEVERVLDAGDKGVVVLLRFRAIGRSSRIPVEFPWAVVCTLRNGRIATSRAINSHEEGLKAAGLEE